MRQITEANPRKQADSHAGQEEHNLLCVCFVGLLFVEVVRYLASH